MIRRYRPDDEEALIALWLAATIAGQSFLPAEHWTAMEPEIRELLPATETWVVEKDGRLVAFLSLLGTLIGGLFTHPDHQGMGHAGALVEHVRGRFDPLLVEVFAVNERALRFYRARGFVDHRKAVDEGSGLVMLTLRAEAHPTR